MGALADRQARPDPEHRVLPVSLRDDIAQHGALAAAVRAHQREPLRRSPGGRPGRTRGRGSAGHLQCDVRPAVDLRQDHGDGGILHVGSRHAPRLFAGELTAPRAQGLAVGLVGPVEQAAVVGDQQHRPREADESLIQPLHASVVAGRMRPAARRADPCRRRPWRLVAAGHVTPIPGRLAALQGIGHLPFGGLGKGALGSPQRLLHRRHLTQQEVPHPHLRRGFQLLRNVPDPEVEATTTLRRQAAARPAAGTGPWPCPRRSPPFSPTLSPGLT